MFTKLCINKLKTILIAFCLIFSTSAFAKIENNKSDKIKSEISNTKKNITEIEKTLKANKNRYSFQQQKLSQIELKINNTVANLKENNIAIKEKQLLINTLNKEIEKLLPALQEEKLILAHHLLQLFKHQHEQQTLRLILKQNNLDGINKLNTYYKYFNSKRINTINSQTQTINQIKIKITTLAQEKTKLLQLQKAFKERTLQLTKQKKSRQDLLTKYKQKINADFERLEQLNNKHSELNLMLKAIKKTIMPKSTNPLSGISGMEGNLKLPIHTKEAHLSALPGVKDIKGKYKNVYIKAPEGTTIHSIYQGQVIFAQWLSGLGLLMVIDHGDGFMSLYGNAQSLYKNPGEWVSAGEPIASVGKSGGHAKVGLYFELRKEGQPLDPNQWFS